MSMDTLSSNQSFLNHSLRFAPSPMWMETVNMSANVTLLIFFFVGISGNVWVLSLLARSHKLQKAAGGHRSETTSPMVVYVVGLSLVDSLALLTVPSTVVNGFLHQWVFGELWCRLAFGIEGVNKVWTTFIMVGLAGDRYLAVCHGVRSRKLRDWRVALLMVVSSAFTAAGLLAPAVIFTHLVIGLDGNLYCITLWPSKDWATGFIVYLFVAGFCIPGLLIAFCYCQILFILSKHTRSVAHTQISLRKISLSTLLIVAFYFFCWTPFWLYNIIILVNPPPPHRSNFLAGRLITLLPIANAALNWIFYALMNQTLRKRMDAARNGTMRKSQQATTLLSATTVQLSSNPGAPKQEEGTALINYRPHPTSAPSSFSATTRLHGDIPTTSLQSQSRQLNGSETTL